MKKMFLIAALAVFGMNQSNAQVKFGVKAGPQLTNLVGDDFEDSDSKFGFMAGAYANIRFAEQFAFQPEVLYSLQGTKGETMGTDVTTNLSYINVPLMMKWYAYDGLNFEFGPQVGFNVGSKVNVDGSGTELVDGDYDFDEVYGNDVETVDFGLNIGAGYEMPMGLNFGVRYGLGLTDIVKDADAKNSVISLGIGYSF
jgi:hypothetical protein